MSVDFNPLAGADSFGPPTPNRNVAGVSEVQPALSTARTCSVFLPEAGFHDNVADGADPAVAAIEDQADAEFSLYSNETTSEFEAVNVNLFDDGTAASHCPFV